MAGSSAGAMLSADEARAVEALLAQAWGEPVEVRAAEAIWERRHVVRLSLDTGRTAVLKRRRDRAGWRGARLAAAGISLGQEWEDLTTAALAGLIIARAHILARALQEDSEWGTTTMRPRLLTWLASFTARDGGGNLPRLRATAEAMRDRLAARWQGPRIPDYPALARAGSVLARVPDGWQPEL
jgi:hypothetical protein